MAEAIDVVTEFNSKALMRPLAEAGEFLRSTWVTFRDDVLPFFDRLDPVFDVIDKAQDALGPVVDFLDTITSALPDLSCPSWLGPICDLDSILIEIIDSIITAISSSLPTLSQMEEFIMQQVLKALNLDDIINVFGNIPNPFANFLQPIIDKFESLGDIGECIQSAVNGAGVPVGAGSTCATIFGNLGLPQLPNFDMTAIADKVSARPRQRVSIMMSAVLQQSHVDGPQRKRVHGHNSIQEVKKLLYVGIPPSLTCMRCQSASDSLRLQTPIHGNSCAQLPRLICQPYLLHILPELTLLNHTQPQVQQAVNCVSTAADGSTAPKMAIGYWDVDPQLTCAAGEVPVALQAKYTCKIEACSEDLTGLFRFPCGEQTAACLRRLNTAAS